MIGDIEVQAHQRFFTAVLIFYSFRKIAYLKGQSHEIFYLFFRQTSPPGPSRDVLGPF